VLFHIMHATWRDSVTTPIVHTSRSRLRVATAVVAAAALAVTAAVTTAAPPAAASSAFTSAVHTSWAYTDTRTPFDLHLESPGDIPAGAWQDDDNKRHISRGYVTFDLSDLLAEINGRFVYQASLTLFETQASNCEDRPLEVWATDPLTADSSWDNRPARLIPLELIHTHEGICPGFDITWSAEAALDELLATGATTLTLELSVPPPHMADLTQGRWFSSEFAQFSVEYERLPLPRPVVTSTDYPESFEFQFGAGIPGDFTFDARGITDIVGFQYVWNDVFGVGDPFAHPGFVFADEPGGSVTVTLAPPQPFQNRLRVRTVGADGTLGGIRDYQLLIIDTAPFITWDQTQVAPGVPFEITFTPVLDGAVAYAYRVMPLSSGVPGPEVPVPADPDGTATAFVTVDSPGLYFLEGRMDHEDGWSSPWSFFLLVVS
jgi:hypothetical protein